MALGRAHDLQVEILGPEEATALGMGMFMAVGRGSDNPPRFIVMRSGAPGATDARGRLLAMIGKGVTFDSGGISLKPADQMEEMKTDKTGACTVINAIATVAALAPGLPLMAVAPAVENMPGPHSTRPGDVVRALNGKVVEIQNTDAEGRLILGDAMTWAERNGATHLVDVATLTGAVHRALGTQITGGFGTPQAWWDEVAAAGARQAERTWQLPLVADYRKDLETFYAELNNSSRRGWLAGQERPLPARLRHRALGPPRHRRLGLRPQGDPVHRPRRDRRDPRHARRAGPARRLTTHVPARSACLRWR